MKSAIVGALALLAAVWLTAFNTLAMRRAFMPATEQVRRETFEQSKAYRDGMLQELRGMQFAYLQADPEHKAAIASLIRHRAAGFPVDAMPSDLADFIKGL